MIKLIVGPVNTQIKGLSELEIIDAISAEISYFVPGHKYNFNFKMGRWDGRERLLTRKLTFPSGLVLRVADLLRSRGLAYEIIEHIEYPDIQETLLWSGPALYPYQETIIERALDKNRGMIKAATGAGKSVIIAKMVAEYNVPTMVYVISLDLLSQMKETLEETLGVPVGVIGGGECEIRKITICSVWTAGLACGEKFKRSGFGEDVVPDKWEPSDVQRAQIVEAVHGARLVILDEAQFAAANSVRMILKYSDHASYKFGCSATPTREQGDDLLLEAAFGGLICDVNATQLIREGYLVPPRISFRDIPPYYKKLPRKWAAVKSSYISNNDVRNEILIQNARALLEMGRKPLMLFRELSHGKTLLKMIPEDVRVRMVSGSVSKEERNQVRYDFEAGKIDLILGSTVFDQGINLPSLNALVLCGGGKSSGRALQRIGRSIRGHPGKTDALVVETFDQAHYVQDHSLARHAVYKTEPAFSVQVGDEMSRYVK